MFPSPMMRQACTTSPIAPVAVDPKSLPCDEFNGCPGQPSVIIAAAISSLPARCVCHPEQHDEAAISMKTITIDASGQSMTVREPALTGRHD